MRRSVLSAPARPGLEVAAEFAEEGRSRDPGLRCPFSGRTSSVRGRRAAARKLNRLGVAVIDGPGATAVEVHADSVILADGREIASAVTIWTAGFGVPDLAARSGLTQSDPGQHGAQPHCQARICRWSRRSRRG